MIGIQSRIPLVEETQPRLREDPPNVNISGARQMLKSRGGEEN